MKVLPVLFMMWFGTRTGQLWGGPPNDAIADRIVLHGEDFIIGGSMDGATLESSTGIAGGDPTWPEPALWFLNTICEVDPRYWNAGSVWYEWVAPRDGTVVMIPDSTWNEAESLPCEPALVCFIPFNPSLPHGVVEALSELKYVEYCQRHILTPRYPYGGFYAEKGLVYLFQVYGAPRGEFRFRCIMSRGPFIAEQPIDRNLLVGETSFLSVVATGSPIPEHIMWPQVAYMVSPLSYQWYRGNQVLEGQTNSTLMLQSETRAQVDHFHVVITDREASVTSRVARVSICEKELAPRLELLGIAGNTNEWLCRLDGEPGRIYRVESSTNLVDWENQFITLPKPWSNEVTVVTGGKPGNPYLRPNHLQLETESARFLIRSSGTRRYFKATRMSPVNSFRSAVLWMVQYGKEDRSRQNGYHLNGTDSPSSVDVAFRVPYEIRDLAFGGASECRAPVSLGSYFEVPKWPCITTNEFEWRDPYNLANPDLVWKAQGMR